jgi:hypothetical protein
VILDSTASAMQAEARLDMMKDPKTADLPPYPGTPRWVKVFGVIVIGLILLVVIIVFTGIGGPHGPGRHNLEYQQGQKR